MSYRILASFAGCLLLSLTMSASEPKRDAPPEPKFELEFDLEPQKFKVQDGLAAGMEYVISGQVFLWNKSGKDAKYLYKMFKGEALRAEIFDKDGKRVVNERYANERRIRNYSPYSIEPIEVKLPYGEKTLITYWDPVELLQEAKQPPGTYKLVAHFETNGLPKITSKEIAVVLKEK